MVRFDILWKNHPGTFKLCNVTEFPNQCAIRMSEAFGKSGVDLTSFSGEDVGKSMKINLDIS